MSILNLLSGQSEDNTEGTTRLTNVSGSLALGGAAFLVAKENNFFKSQTKNAFSSLTSNRLVPETARAGQAIRENVDLLKEATKTTKKLVLEQTREALLKDETLDKILNTDNLDEARSFLNAIYEEISGRDIEGTFDDILKQTQSIVNDPNTLADQNRNLIKDFFKTHIATDEVRFGRFQSSYQRRLKVSNLFEKKENVFDIVGSQIKQEEFDSIENYKSSIYVKSKRDRNEVGNIINKVNKRFNTIKGMAGTSNVSLVGYDEYGSGVRSLYARVSFSDSRTLNIPLHLERNEKGLMYYRATENLSTRYQAPLKVIDANELLKGASLTTSSSEALSRASMDFDQYVFKSIESNLGNRRKFNNLTGRNINDINSFIRSFGTDVPRGMVYGTGSKRLDEQLINSRVAQSGIGFIAGLEKMTREQQSLVHRRLIQMFPENFGGPPSSQTILQRLENPFQRGSELMFKNVQLLGHGIASIEQMDVFGRLDRSIQPQTAREQQMYGRPEVIEKVYGLQSNATIGRHSTTQVLGGSGGQQLIGMKKDARMLGINVANIIAFGDQQVEKLGLSEGMSLFGGDFQISSSLTKTVVEEDLLETKLMKRLIEKGKDGLNIGEGGDMTVDEFFKEFGDEEGRAILGKLDKDFSHIKRQGGLEGLFLKISGFSEETGRKRYHISGRMDKNFRSGKAFGTFLKDTLKNVNEDVFNQYLDRINGTQLFQRAGMNIKSSVLTTNDFIKKSEQYLMTTMTGGLELLGGDTTALKKNLANRIGKDQNFIKLINKKYGTNYQSLDAVPAAQRAGTQLHEFITEFTRIGSKLGPQQFGAFQYTLSYAAQLAKEGKFELTQKSFTEAVKAGFTRSSIKNNQQNKVQTKAFLKAIEDARSSGIMLGAGSMFAGTHHSELGRNLAKTEPRLANYLYSSLRSNFGFSSEEASQYIGSLVSRQQGIEGRANAVAGMQLMSESISNVSDKRVVEKMNKLGVEKFSQEEVEKLLQFGQNEKDLIDFLKTKKQGGILDLEDINFKDSTALEQLKTEMGGKTKIYLPGADVLENMVGHEIRTTQKVLDIEAEYKRGLADLLSGIGSFETAEDQISINKSIGAVQFGKTQLAKITGTALRESLSGRVLGSGSYAGAGLTLGGEGEEIYSEDAAKQTKISDKFKKLYNKEKGYLAFIDAQTYLDGMTSYRAALKKEFPNATNKQINEMMTESLKDFFLGMHRKDETGISGLLQRNPTIGFGHYMPGMSLYRYDYFDDSLDGIDDKIFNLLKEKQDVKGAKFDITKDTKDKIYKDAFIKRRDELDAERKAKFETDTGKKVVSKTEFQKIKDKHIKARDKSKAFQERLNKFIGAYSGQKSQYDEATGKFIKTNDFDNLPLNLSELKEQIKLDENLYGTRSDLKRTLNKRHQTLKRVSKDSNLDVDNQKALKNKRDEMIEEAKRLKQEKDAAFKAYKTQRDIRAEYFDPQGSNQLGSDAYKTQIKTAQQNALNEALTEAEDLFERGQALPEGFSRKQRYRSNALQQLEHFTGQKITSFEQLEKINRGAETITKGGKTLDVQKTLSRVMHDVLKVHTKYGESGGGLVRFPNVNLTASLVDEGGTKLSTYSGRMDYSRFAIGDYDADIYQIFFDTKRNISAKINKSAYDSGGLYEYGAKFLVSMEELGKGMSKLGERLGAGKLTLMESRINELEKERIIKDVGGLDVQVKTAMLGLVQASAESQDFNQAMRLRGSGAALVSVAQEVLAIKAKKLPLAADVASQFANILREGFKTGKGADKLKTFFMENVLKDTAFAKGKSISLKNIQFSGVPEGPALDAMRERLSNVRINMDELFETFDVMFKTVHERGIQNFGSNSKMMNTLNKGGQSSMDMLNFLFSKYGSMEGGFLSKDFDFDEFDTIINRQQEARKQLFSQFKMPKMGGLVGAALGASYLVGSMQSVSQLETENKFSDMKARQSLSNKNLYRLQDNASKDIPVQALGGPQNFYERPIHLNDSYVNLTKSQHVFAQAPTEFSGAMMGKIMADAGGKSNFMIHDQRHRISQSEITRNLTS